MEQRVILSVYDILYCSKYTYMWLPQSPGSNCGPKGQAKLEGA